MKTTVIFIFIFILPLAIFSQEIAIDSLENRIQSLENKVSELAAWEEALNRVQDSNDKMFIGMRNILLVILAFLGIRDAVVFWRSKDIEKSARANIDQITRLIGSLDSLFTFIKDAEQIKADVKTIQGTLIDDENKAKEQKRTINENAIKIAQEITRDNYKSVYYSQVFRNFRNNLNKIVEEDPRLDEDLNANCFQVLALDLILQSLFEEALDVLKEGKKRANKYALQVPPEFIFPIANKTDEQKKSWHKKLSNILIYHEAIINYNLGRHEIAESLFRTALEFDPLDAKSMIYIPESKYLRTKYLGETNEFNTIIKDYSSLEKKLKLIDEESTKSWGESKKSILTLLYIRYGNCFYPTSHIDNKRSFKGKPFEDISKAGKYYELAYKHSPNSYIAKFSYAQALRRMAQIEFSSINLNKIKNKYEQLFREVFGIVQEKTGETIETKILIMMYYILVICSVEANLNPTQAKRYITKIYEKGVELPQIKGFRIFSPLTKNDLTFKELRAEIRQYSKSIESPPQLNELSDVEKENR